MQQPGGMMKGNADLEGVLSACLSPDNTLRQQAEAALKGACKQPEVLHALLGRLKASHSPEVRLLAAQGIRRHAPKHWRRLSPQVREGVQSGLQEAVGAEHVASVRQGVCGAIAVIARTAVPGGQWPGLLPWLHGCTQSANEEHREVALVLLCSLTDTIGEHLRPHFATLVRVAAAGLADGAERVRAAALAAVAKLVEWVAEEPEVKAFRELVPTMLQMAQASLAAGKEQAAIDCCEIFIDLIEAPAPVMGPVLPDLVRWAMAATSDASLELTTREMALQVVEWLARYKPKQLAKSGMVRPVVAALCTLCAEPDPPDHDGEDQLSAAKFAAQAIDVLALHLPSKHVLPEALAYAAGAIRSPDPLQRAAACTAIVDVAEGCADAVRKQLPTVLQVVGAGAGDADARVRGQAMFALGELASHCQPDMGAHVGGALPHVFAAMAGDDPTLVQQACYALDCIVEHLEEEISEHLEPLLARLGEVLARRTSTESQMSALGAISSAAYAAQGSFQPYAPAVLPLLRQYMGLTQEELLPCRARATEAVGIILRAVGAEAAGQTLPDLIAAALQGMALDDDELREYGHGMLGNVAQELGAGFGPYLQPCVEAAIASCSQDDGVAEEDTDEEGTAESQSLGSDSDDAGAADDEDDDDNEAAGRRLNIRTSVLDEKAAATQALGLYAKHTLAGFAPFIEPALAVLLRMAAYFHDDVREQAYEALSFLVLATDKAFPSPTPGACSPQAQHVVDAAMPALLEAVEKDDDKEAVSVAIAAAAGIMRGVGAGPARAYVGPLAAAVGKVARGEALCQVAEDEGDEPLEDEEEAEENNPDENLLVAVGDALPILAKAMGADAYAPVFAQQHADALFKWLRPSQPDSVRASATGALGDLAKELGWHMGQHAGRLAPVLTRELRCGDAANRRNAAFAAGELVRAAPQAMAPVLPSLLQALHPLFRASEDAGTRDNAAGAVGRILSAVGAQLPLEQVVPVLLGALPLQEDYDEAEAVYGALADLLVNPETAHRVSPSLAPILQALASALVQQEVPQAVRKQIALSLARLQSQQVNPHVGQVLAALPPDQAHALHELTSQPLLPA